MIAIAGTEAQSKMGIDITTEQLVSFGDGRKLPGKPTWGQLTRWADAGIVARFTKRRVFLEYAYLGFSRYTSVEAVVRFSAQLSEKVQHGPPKPRRSSEAKGAGGEGQAG